MVGLGLRKKRGWPGGQPPGPPFRERALLPFPPAPRPSVRPLDGRRQAFVMKSVIKNKPLRKGEGVESKAGSIVPEAV